MGQAWTAMEWDGMEKKNTSHGQAWGVGNSVFDLSYYQFFLSNLVALALPPNKCKRISLKLVRFLIWNQSKKLTKNTSLSFVAIIELKLDLFAPLNLPTKFLFQKNTFRLWCSGKFW